MEHQLTLIRMDIGHVLNEVEKIATQPEPLATWFSGIVALVAVLVTGYISRLQIKQTRELKQSELRANVIADARKTWAKDLRDTVAKILSCNSLLLNSSKNDKRDIVDQCISEIHLQFAYLKLLLDPSKKNHEDLNNSALLYYGKIVEVINNHPSPIKISMSDEVSSLLVNGGDMYSARNALLVKVQDILEENWRKIRQNS
ncbi:hypothetical protein L2D14_14405 [Thalassospiraceae bacterium LMO-JJ14]|nr:hypothetical protein L2D14_14405 [Thalassospiraceae bacterium LMO-JJ14]